MFMTIGQSVFAWALTAFGGILKFPKPLGGIEGGAVNPSAFGEGGWGKG